ncbi:MAG TPA: GTPase ObgE [Candidatus Angelobacter sp.]|jgi:GTP-binding protein|nr:GTPase ObgE [Candidatus Angelobacter sp.]
MYKNFIDNVKIYCKSGKGGYGSVHFRRDRGADGGNVIFRGNHHCWTLLHLKYKKHHIAENGFPVSGAKGKNCVIEIPIGTVVKNEKNEILLEITKNNQTKILFKGGKGGLGNWNYRSSKPCYSQYGMKGREGWIILELKLLSDVGLVGFPNSGKSSLLAAITSSKPKIAEYAFTTLTPHLGIVFCSDYRDFIIADIPGFIEGASKGKGLGYRFLKHLERNSVLLFLIPANTKDFEKEYEILLSELREYNPCLLEKPRLIVISKSDLINENIKIKKNLSFQPIFISSKNKEGLIDLKEKLLEKVQSSTYFFR